MKPQRPVKPPGRDFLVVLDWRYLPRAIALYRSLEAVCPAFRLRVYCMDDATERILNRLALPCVSVVGIGELERDDPELRALRGIRSEREYCWTAKPAALLHALTREPELELLTLLDADLYFYEDPAVLLSELGPQDSILLVPHRYAPEFEHWVYGSGEYNSGLVSFRNDGNGLDALRWWRERCLEWSDYHIEPEQPDPRIPRRDRPMFQSYLHEWPTSRPGVQVLRHSGGGLAPWNMHGHQLELRADRVHVDGWPLVFYHFSTLRLYRGLASLRRYGFGKKQFELTVGSRPMVWSTHRMWGMSAADHELVWHGYVHKLASALDEVAAVEPHFEVRTRGDRNQFIRAVVRLVVPGVVRRLLYAAYVASVLKPIERWGPRGEDELDVPLKPDAS